VAGAVLRVLSLFSDDDWRVDYPLSGVNPTMPVTIYTDRLGYSEDFVMACDNATVITVSNAPITVSALTPQEYQPVTQASGVTPNGTTVTWPDGVFRTLIGCDLYAARFIQFVVGPSNTLSLNDQWGFQRIDARVTVSKAGPEDY
jgi:hypothetical protein